MALRRDATVTIVEPFFESDSLPSKSWNRDVLEATIRAIREARPDLDISQIEAASVEAVRLAPTASAIYIDACHEYAECRADIELWQTRLRPGGVLFGHDYSPRHPGVMDAVNEVLPVFRLISDTRIWVAE